MKGTRQRFGREEDIIGLDIHDGRMAAAHFVHSEEGLTLNRLAVDSYSAELTARQLAARIRAFWKKEDLSSRLVCSCLHSRSLVVRYFQYTNLSENELPMVLSLEAEEALQLPGSELCMDWHLNPSDNDPSPDLKKLSGVLVAAPRKTVRHHLDLIQAAGLYSVNVEVSCSALCTCYSFLREKEGLQPVCLINLTERTADIIMRDVGSTYPRTLFSADENWDTNEDYLLENIQNALLYYHLKIKQGPVEKIVLIGKLSDPENFPVRLSRKVSLPVETLNICDHFTINAEKPDIPVGYNLATVIGLALRGVDHEPV